MDNKIDFFNMPLASFTFGKDEQKNETNKNNYIDNSKSLYMNPKPNTNNNKNQIQSSLSQDYIQTNKYNNYNNSLSNFSKNFKKNVDLKENNDNINNNYNNSNSFFNTNQSAKLINSNYGGEFTFGQSNDIPNNTNDTNNILNENKFYNNTLKNNYHNKLNENDNKKNIFLNKNGNFLPPIFFDNSNNDANSYIIVILYTIYHIESLRKYILNLNINKKENLNNETNNNILYFLKDIYLQIGNNNNSKINIHNLKQSLFYSFRNRRKFIINQPDDPVDLLFVILNAIHSLCINTPINEISEELCNKKCFSHKYIWMDLTRIDECECNGALRRLFSNHNYITDIPMFQIFLLIDNIYSNSQNFILIEIYQKIFSYYKDILHNLKMNCPLNGNRCSINKTHHRLFLANSPSYFIFNLDYNQNNNNNNIFNNFSLLNILKSFILISKTLDISTLFEENMRNKNDYNSNKNYILIGIIFLSLTKIYSCAFKVQTQNKNIQYNYYKNDNNYISFNSFYNLIFYSIKNGLIPIMLIYQDTHIDNNSYNNINNNDLLSNEQIMELQKYCISIDNYFNIININKIRNNENILNTISNINNNGINSQNINLIIKNNKNNIAYSKFNQNINIENNNNINENNYFNNINKNNNNNSQYHYKSNTYKNKSHQKQNNIYVDSDNKRERLSLQIPNKNNYMNNNLNDFNDNNIYLVNNQKNFKTNENNNINIINENNNKKYRKIKNATEIKNNKISKPNNEEYPHSVWEMPVPYLPYKKEEPITILPIQNQNSIEVNTKNNSNNYFYKHNKNNINNIDNVENAKKGEIKQKSNSYSKKNKDNFKSIINQFNLNSNNNNNINLNNNINDKNINPNSDNEFDFKNRIPINKEMKINSNNINKAYFNKNNNNLYNYMYNNPNSFNKNHNLRNLIKDSAKKYQFNKINRSNFDLSANRPSNYRYENNMSNISYNNQNLKYISDDAVPSNEIKKKFKDKKLVNQIINYSSNNNKIRNSPDINNNSINNKNRNISKSEDNTNNNIYNFNYIYNNNNFDMNILGNNLEKNNSYNIINKSNDIQKDNNSKKNNNNNMINIKNISNINNNKSNSYIIDKENNNIKNNNSQNIIKSNDTGHWTCDYCSNINRDDYIYCKICKRNKKGKILRINTQLLNSNHSLKKNGSVSGNRPNTSSNKKSQIYKNKKMQNNNSLSNRINNSNKNNNKNDYINNNKSNLKKIKRNTIVGFPSSKNFNSNENYNNHINNQQAKRNYFSNNSNNNSNNNNDSIKKEYSFSKASFNERKYNIY